MTHRTEHTWESAYAGGKPPFIRATKESALHPEGFRMQVTIGKGAIIDRMYQGDSIIMTLDTYEMEFLGMELIRIAAAARAEP